MQKYISFPKSEYDCYLNRLKANKIIYTTRVSNEVNKYKINEKYNSDFGILQVVFFKHFSKLSDHPFLNELSHEQILLINKYINDNGYDVIGLIRL